MALRNKVITVGDFHLGASNHVQSKPHILVDQDLTQTRLFFNPLNHAALLAPRADADSI